MPTTRGYPFPVGTDPADVPADIQALAEAVDTDVADVETDAAAALATHDADTTGIHGIADTAALATTAALGAHEADTTSIHGIADTSTLYRAGGTDVAVADGGTGASTAAGARANLAAAPLASPPLTGTVTIDGDTNLYRAAANALKTDDDFISALSLVAFGGGGGQIQVGAAGGTPLIYFGSALDTNLYRAAADTLQTDDDFRAGGNLSAKRGSAAQMLIGAYGPASEAGIQFGSGQDTNLYRSAANVLKTDDEFFAAAGVQLQGSRYALGTVLNSQKVIWGVVNASGAIDAGSGFTVNRPSTGHYDITYTAPFVGNPAVVAVRTVAQRDDLAVLSGNSVASVTVIDSAGAFANGGFSFIAIGNA